MSALEIGLASFPALLVLIFLRVPIGLAMFLVGFCGLYFVTGGTNVAFSKLKSETYSTFSSYSLSIIPMFLLMGHFATLGGMSQALFKATESWLGHRKGGVAMAAIGACAGFGAIAGSSLATAATMGRVALPELKAYGYAGGFSTATLAAGGTLGILIPPSVVLVIYAILTEQNIAKLFLAAFIPGLLAALGYIFAISIYVRVFPNAAGTRPRVPAKERLKATLKIWPVMLIFLLVIYGIAGDWNWRGAGTQALFTPTEGAAVGAFGVGLIAWLNGGLSWASLGESFTTTAKSTAMIFFIILGAAFYNGFLGLTQVPQEIANWVVSQGLSPLSVLILILVFYLLLGCLMDSLSMILLTIPIFFPVIQSLDFGFVSLPIMQADAALEALKQGVQIAPETLSQVQEAIATGAELTRDQMKELGIRVTQGIADRKAAEMTAIWFGILVLIVVEVGLITPPVGLNLFVIGAMDKKTPVVETYKAVMFFVVTDIFRVAILIAFPAITLYWLLG